MKAIFGSLLFAIVTTAIIVLLTPNAPKAQSSTPPPYDVLSAQTDSYVTSALIHVRASQQCFLMAFSPWGENHTPTFVPVACPWVNER